MADLLELYETINYGSTSFHKKLK